MSLAPAAAPGVETIADVVALVVDTLTAAGIAAAGDIRDLNPPGVYVPSPVVRWDRVGIGYSCELELWAVVPNMGRLDALTALGPMLEQIRTVYPVSMGSPADLTPAEAGDPLPGYRLPLTLTVCA